MMKPGDMIRPRNSRRVCTWQNFDPQNNTGSEPATGEVPEDGTAIIVSAIHAQSIIAIHDDTRTWHGLRIFVMYVICGRIFTGWTWTDYFLTL